MFIHSNIIFKDSRTFLKDFECSKEPHLICEGLMLGNSGFAEAMRNVVLNLDEKGCIIQTRIHDKDCIEAARSGKLGRLKAMSKYRFDSRQPFCWLTMTHPLGIEPHPGYYSIGYVMFETESFPDVFVEHLKSQDEIWTPTTFCRDSMEKAGLKNVHVMPLGVNVDRFNPDLVESIECMSLLENRFKFLCIMGWSERKGVSVLIRAFVEEFKDQDGVVLYLKGGWYNPDQARSEILELVKDITDVPMIYIDFDLYSYNNLPKLYKFCDCYVMASRGEGWGLEYSEAMSMGMPTIGTNWSGNLDFMNQDNSYLINTLVPKPCPACDWITPQYIGANFADPDKEHLKKLMRYVYNNQEEARQMGARARKYMIENFTWVKSTEKHYQRLIQLIR